ncbi:MAG TPA: hypothetical protein VK830_07125 [Xanthomonadales bacterium]|nr:hypothetical protein [Xanthomonadales bacterium]
MLVSGSSLILGALSSQVSPCSSIHSLAMSWMQRLKRVFAIDIETCPECGGKLRVIGCTRHGFTRALLGLRPNRTLVLACAEESALMARILGHVQQRLEPDNQLARAPPGHQEPTLNLMGYSLGGQSGGRVSVLGALSALDAAALIVARKSQDPAADTVELVEALVSNIQRMKDAGIMTQGVDFESALSAWFQGDAEAALYALEKSVRVPLFMPANLHYLQNHPGYAPIRDMREAWLRDERQAFLDVVCQGNPYAAVWQPQPKTCEE